MSILDRLTGKRGGKVIPTNATFRLTQEGRDKLQEFAGDPPSRILVALESRGTSDLDEVTSSSGLNRGQVERLIPSLVKKGYVQYVSANAGDEQ